MSRLSYADDLVSDFDLVGQGVMCLSNMRVASAYRRMTGEESFRLLISY